jgi:hypothetical protein
MTKTTLTYEMKPCGRCGGSGSYSYCSMYGSRCFGCAGRKRVLTAAGAKASKAVTAFIAANFSVAIEALVPGDRVKIDGVARTVESVTADGGTGSYTKDGVTVTVPYLTVHFTKPITSAYGPYTATSYPAGTKLVKAVGGADWETVVAFAKTIKKGVTLVETPAVPA